MKVSLPYPKYGNVIKILAVRPALHLSSCLIFFCFFTVHKSLKFGVEMAVSVSRALYL